MTEAREHEARHACARDLRLHRYMLGWVGAGTTRSEIVTAASFRI